MLWRAFSFHKSWFVSRKFEPHCNHYYHHLKPKKRGGLRMRSLYSFCHFNWNNLSLWGIWGKLCEPWNRIFEVLKQSLCKTKPMDVRAIWQKQLPPVSPSSWLFSFYNRGRSFVQGSCCLLWDWTLNTRWPTEIDNYFLQECSTSKGLETDSSGSDSEESACNAGHLGSIPRWERSPAEEVATHSTILAWGSLWIEEPGRLQSMGLQRFGHKWMTNTFRFESLDLFVTYNKFYWYWPVLIFVCVLYREQTKYSWLWNNVSLNCVGILLIGVFFSTVNTPVLSHWLV